MAHTVVVCRSHSLCGYISKFVGRRRRRPVVVAWGGELAVGFLNDGDAALDGVEEDFEYGAESWEAGGDYYCVHFEAGEV